MDKCPEKELLEQFLGNELSEEMNEEIFLHINICKKCNDIVMCLIRDERNLLHSLLTFTRYREKEIPFSAKCLSKLTLIAYCAESLDKKHSKEVESHLEECDKCLTEMIELQRSLTLPSQVELDMSILKDLKTENYQPAISLFDIVLKIKGDILELIEHTGDISLLTPQVGAVRGKKHERKSTIAVRKDLKDRDLSIEITIVRDLDKPGNYIKISLMRLRTEKFISARAVSISGMGLHQKVITNEEGTAEFHGINMGQYKIDIFNGIIVSINIIK